MPKKNLIKYTKSLILRRLHILEWLPNYTKSDCIADFIAGLTVGLTMMPQAIAYASLAGLPAQYGLYSAFIGSFTYVLLGTIKEVSIGPTSLMALLTFSYTEGKPIEFVVLLTFLVGIVEFLMGVFKLGFMVDFMSPNVTSGFTSAMAVITVITQLKNLLGLKNFQGHGTFDVLQKLIARHRDIAFGDTLLGVSCIIFLFAFKQLPRIKTKNKSMKKALWLLSISKNALTVLITAVIAFFLCKIGDSPFILSGNVPQGLPAVKPPSFSAVSGNHTYNFFEMVGELGSGIIVVPIAGVLANVAIAKAYTTGVIVDATQEMMTLGIANMFGSFIQAIPSCGAFTRSAVASSSGVRTPLQGIYSGTIILLALSFLTPYFYYIPRATLAAVLISAIVSLFDYEIFPKLWRCNKFDFYLTVITLIIGTVYGVEIGMIGGGLLNLVILLKAWARPNVESTIRVDNKGNNYIYIKPELGLFYPAVDYLTSRVTEAHNSANNLPIILDFINIMKIDYSACQAIDNLAQTYNDKSHKLTFLNIKPEIFDILKNTVGLNNLQLTKSVENLYENSETSLLIEKQI